MGPGLLGPQGGVRAPAETLLAAGAGSALTLTSCWGKGPREFSGTLMGGMTQSRFCRLSPRASWCWGHGSSVSLGARAGSGSAAFLPFCSTTWRGERSHNSG